MKCAGPHDFGRIGAQYEEFLISLIAERQPRRMMMEAPNPPQRQSAINAGRLSLGLVFLTEKICHQMNVPLQEAAVMSVRKVFLGHGRPFPDPLAVKKLVMQVCLARGWRPGSFDEADACAVWWYLMRNGHEGGLVLPEGFDLEGAGWAKKGKTERSTTR